MNEPKIIELLAVNCVNKCGKHYNNWILKLAFNYGYPIKGI